MSLFTASLHPNAGLGFLLLGASLHDVLTRLKAEPQRFPKLDLAYSPQLPVAEPVVLSLPANGIRLRFDGPEQRLRLIEVLDFTKSRITYQDKDLVKPPSANPTPTSDALPTGPAFKNVYHRLFGPTYAGEYIPPSDGNSSTPGTYILSYPGVAFSFPLHQAAYSPDKDVVNLLSSSASQTAISLAIFSGKSWAHARDTLWTELLPSIKSSSLYSKSKDIVPDEISLVRVHGAGKLQLFKKWTSSSFWIRLGETSPQELVAELGPPDAIYRKNDQRMYIHKTRAASHSRSRSNNGDYRRPDETDTDQSSANTASDDSDDENADQEFAGNVSGECFYNYFYLGFDILVSRPVPPSRAPPSQAAAAAAAADPDPLQGGEAALRSGAANRLVATKVVLHANVPGSYPFNRHRRCRWEVAYLPPDPEAPAATSEAQFGDLEERLREEWRSTYASEHEARNRQRGMVLNRGWGDSPGSSCELLGGWEDTAPRAPAAGGGGGGGAGARRFDGSDDSTTTLYGFPGLVFEVLKNGFVSAVTVF